MFLSSNVIRRLGATAIALALSATCAPLAAFAQDVPSYAQPSYASADETIHGRIHSVEGAFNISVDDDRGFIDSVQLHQGTIINPTGLTLSPGMSVTILGANAGSAFSANEIDTPYTYAGPLPEPAYYGPGYWCPGFAYGYGPSFSLAIIIGGGSRPWYYEHRPYYGRPWNGRGYFGAAIAYAPQNRRRFEGRPGPAVHVEATARDGVRGDVRKTTIGAPPAFAGRSFAGDHDRFGTESTARPPAMRAVPAEPRAGYARNAASSENIARGAARGGYERGGASREAGQPHFAGGRAAGGGHSAGGGHATGGGGHGGGHAH
jgi:hypothetical protein